MRSIQGHGKRLTYYDFGRTPFFALQTDKRFSYCLAVPEDYDEEGDKSYTLIVLVHGTERSAAMYRDRLAGFAAAHSFIFLSSLFPSHITSRLLLLSCYISKSA